MPYIKQKAREKFHNTLSVLTPEITTPGELNYVITRLCCWYLHNQGQSYTSLNEVVGVLECAKQELYRRLVAPYEDGKIKENGDAYGVECCLNDPP